MSQQTENPRWSAIGMASRHADRWSALARVLSEIIVETAIGEIAAVITTRSVQGMGLKVGDRVAAVV